MSLKERLFKVPGLAPSVQRSFQREQLCELTLPIATSLMEGGFLSVVAAKTFNADPWVIAVISAAPMFGNLSSFFWNQIATGRPKVPLVVTLQILILLCVAAVAASPMTANGAYILLASVVLSRLLIAGVITARSVAWSLNYERALRARATGQLQAITSMMVVLTTGLGGLLLDARPENFRWLYGGGALLGALGVWSFKGVSVLGEQRHRVLERRGTRAGSGHSFLAILREDRRYARYQLFQFVSGVAAMMLEPPLVYLVSKRIGASYFASIGIVLLIPFLLMMATLPWWARYLDRVHVAEFRARQNAVWVIGTLIMFVGAWQLSLTWLALGRLLTSIVNGGGSLAWQLGHNDFAPRDRLSAYMGVHVTLTGVRGAFAPFLGMALYLGWDSKGYVPGSTGLGPWVFLVSVVLGIIAWRGFEKLSREIGPRPVDR